MFKRRNTTNNIWDIDIPQTKTNKAIIFLCLFNGLRIPTIRLLARKPRTICFEPLNNFDPELYSPLTTNILSSRYQAQIHCPSVDIRVDPTVSDVQTLVKAYGNAALSERTVIHYYGQGSYEPNKNGKIFFFDKSRTTYYSLAVNKLLDPFLSPLTLIIDCDSASALYDPIKKAENIEINSTDDESNNKTEEEDDDDMNAFEDDDENDDNDDNDTNDNENEEEDEINDFDDDDDNDSNIFEEDDSYFND